MKKLLRAAVSMTLITVMIFSLTGCKKTDTAANGGKDGVTSENGAASGTKDTDGAPGNNGNRFTYDEEGHPDLQGTTFTIWFSMTGNNAKATDNMGDYAVLKDLEKLLNCKFEFMSPPIGQESDNFSVLMASDKLPDMIFCNGIDSYYPGGIEMAYADKILYDYTQYINDTYTPNFNKLVMSDAFMKKAAVDDQGRVVRLGSKICGSEEADLTFSGPLLRSDILKTPDLQYRNPWRTGLLC